MKIRFVVRRLCAIALIAGLGLPLPLLAGPQAPAPQKPPEQKPGEQEKPRPAEPQRLLTPMGGQPIQQRPDPAAPAQAPAPPAQQPPAAPPQQPPAQPPAPSPGARISLHLENANLMQVIGIIASELRMNYVVDPAVKGVVTINTMGEVRQEDLLPLLQAILRANGAAAVQSGSFWRIVPVKEAPRVPIGLSNATASEDIPADDRMVMNVVAMSYVSAADMAKILGSYLSEAGHIVTHEAGNILLITDTSRSMRRLMDLVRLFDSDVLANQRVRVFPVENNQAAAIVKDLVDIFSAYALSEKSSAIRFMPIDRLNSILVVSPNPNVYPEVQQWIEKLDKPTKKSGIQNFVYKVQNASAENLAAVLSGLYGTGSTYRQESSRSGLGGQAGGESRVGMGTAGGTMGLGGAGGGTTGTGMTGGLGAGGGALPTSAPPLGAFPVSTEAAEQAGILQSTVRIVADIVNNALIVQATPQDYEQIRDTIQQLDIVPRQVLIEAKVYEVRLTDALAFGVEAFLQQRSDQERRPLASFSAGGRASAGIPAGLSGQVGTLVGRSRELMIFLNAQENRGRTRVVSAPTILASDNQEARIQVGAEIPILTAQGVVAGAQVGGTSVFTNTVQQRDTGVILSVRPRINASGLVTLAIGQEVSSPGPPPNASIASPSIQKRSVVTQVTVQDGETIALGGIIQESRIYSANRIPLLGSIPVIGVLFGNTSTSKERTELIVMLTPRVLQSVDEARTATQEFRDSLRELRKRIREVN